MARLDVYRLRDGSEGLVLDCQADTFRDFRTRVVAPLLPAGGKLRPADRLTPTFDINGGAFVLFPQLVQAMDRAELGDKVTSLAESAYIVQQAFDLLLSDT